MAFHGSAKEEDSKPLTHENRLAILCTPHIAVQLMYPHLENRMVWYQRVVSNRQIFSVLRSHFHLPQ